VRLEQSASERRRGREGGGAAAEDAGQAALPRRQQGQGYGSLSLSAVTAYAIVRREGEEERSRPAASLWWSGVAAGVGIALSVLAEGLLHSKLEGHPFRSLVENLAYTVGFVLVILGRLQLFTENTITVVLPVLAKPTAAKVLRSARLWGIVFVANMVGCLVAAFWLMQIAELGDGHLAGIYDIARHYIEVEGLDALLLGLPPGFITAARGWCLPSAKGSEMLLIVLFTIFIAVGGFTHVIAGAVEVYLMALTGELSAWRALTHHILPTLAGNIIGGAGLFALLAYGQVHEEI